MENNYTVYMHISPSGKRYIGITSRKPKKRWQNGKGYKEQYFTNAINKYGWDNFQHIIVAKGLTEEQAKEMEIELIAKYDSANRDKGYNISLGGDGTNGINPRDYMTEEAKIEHDRKISEVLKGKNNPMYGKDWREGKTEEELLEHKRKISEANKGENHPMYGKHHSEETNRKISESMKGKYCGENHPRVKSVIAIINDKIFGVFDYIKQGAEYFGCNQSTISACCKGKYKSCGKYNCHKIVWRYITIIEL